MTSLAAGKLPWSLGHLFGLSALLLGALGFVYLSLLERQNQVTIWVPVRTLPPYSQIKAADLIRKMLPARSIRPEFVKDPGDILQHYTLATADKDQPFAKSGLGPKLTAAREQSLQGSVLLGIPATPAMIMGGNLKTGDTVDLIVVPETAKGGTIPAPVSFPGILILDIKPDLASAPTPGTPALVVVALPAARQFDFASHSRGATFLITRKASW
jgi:hypothetical protein